MSIAGNSPGDTATYTCNAGYDLVGVSVRECGVDGEWSEVPLICIRKCFHLLSLHNLWSQHEVILYMTEVFPENPTHIILRLASKSLN